MYIDRKMRSDRLLAAAAGAGAALAAAALFALTRAAVPFPGESAGLLAAHAGLTAFPPLTHPLWHAAVRGLLRLPWGTLAGRAAWWSVACGALAVGLLFALVRRIRLDPSPLFAPPPGDEGVLADLLPWRDLPPGEDAPPVTAGAALRTRRPAPAPAEAPGAGSGEGAGSRTFGALVAAAALALSAPFWFVATRAHPAALDTVLLLAVALLVQAHRATGRLARLYLGAALYGVAAAEFPTLLLFAPGFALYALAALLRHRQLRVRPLALCTVLGLAGLFGTYALVAWRFWLHPAAEWHGLGHYGEALWEVLREQYRIVRWSTPDVGWLLLVLLAGLPAVLAALTRGAADPDVRLWMSGVALLVVALGLAFLYNAPVTPFAMFGFRPLLVTPHLAAAAGMGYLAGWLTHALRNGLFRHGEPAGVWFLTFWGGLLRAVEETGDAPRRRRLAAAFGALAAVSVLVAAAVNFPRVDPRPAAAVAAWADRTLAALGPRRWLVSAGPMDDVLLLAAAAHGRELKVLNLQLTGFPAYRRWLAAQFTAPAVKDRALIGPEALLAEWQRQAGRFEDDVAVLDAPDVWLTLGRRPLPFGPLYLGRAAPSAADLDASVAALGAWAGELAPQAGALRRAREPLGGAGEWLLRTASRAANNLGVELERARRPAEAMAGYDEARRLDPRNLSALLNATQLAARHDPGRWPALMDEVNELIRGLTRGLDPMATMRTYGYLTHPAAQVNRAQQWARTGRPDLVDAALEGAESRGVPAALADQLVAGTLLDAGRTAESKAVLRDLYARDTNSTAAVVGLLRAAMQGGDMDAAAQWLERLPAGAAAERLRALLRALIDAGRGDLAAARGRVETLLVARPDDIDAWALLAWIGLEQDDDAIVKRAATLLEEGLDGRPRLALFLARLHLDAGQFEAARRYTVRFLHHEPARVAGRELLLWIDLAEHRQDLAEEHVHDLLRLDPGNAVANHFLGSLHLQRGAYVKAEAALRRSLERQRGAGALNDLAWVLCRQERFEEALPLAREAAGMDPAWVTLDTLGVALEGLGQLTEARRVLSEAVRLSDGHPEVVLHLARVAQKQEEAGAGPAP